MYLCWVLVFATVIGPAQKNDDKPKERPTIKVLADGFPTGHDTPEGAACDLARAFIKRDVKLFDETCIKPFTKGESAEEYGSFLKKMAENIKEEAERKEPSPGGPRAIGKLFASRNLGAGGPASYGWATFGFQEVKFVDVGVTLHNGKRYMNRTLVIKDDKGKWYVHAMPGSSPILSVGLNDESDSKIDFSEVYKILKPTEAKK